MRGLLLIAPTLVVLSGCTRIEAAAPDVRNPAHCIAGFDHAAYWFKIGNRPEKVRAMNARAAFELGKVITAGRSPSTALADARALKHAYGTDQKKMDALFLECSLAQDADPLFREELPELLRRVAAVEAANSAK